MGGDRSFVNPRPSWQKNMYETLEQQHGQPAARPEQLRAMIGEAAKWEIVAHQLALELCGGNADQAFKLIQDTTENVCAYQRESINRLEYLIRNTL